MYVTHTPLPPGSVDAASADGRLGVRVVSQVTVPGVETERHAGGVRCRKLVHTREVVVNDSGPWELGGMWECMMRWENACLGGLGGGSGVGGERLALKQATPEL